MFDATLGTTNLLLGILAAVAVFETLALVGLAVMAWRLYLRSMRFATETRQQLGPLFARLDDLSTTLAGVAADVQEITSRAAANTARAEAVVGTALSLASYGWGGATASVGRKALGLYSVVRGLRAAYRSFRAGGAELDHAAGGG